MKNVPLLLIILLFSCKKNIDFSSTSISVEDFRQSGMLDAEVIQAAIDSAPENSLLRFDNREYIIDHTIMLWKSLKFCGPATLKRADMIDYRLASPASVNDRQLVLNTTVKLKVGDYFFLTNGQQSHLDNSSLNLITAIEGDTLTLYYPNPPLFDGQNYFPMSTKFIKDIKFFWIMDKNVNVFPSQSCSFSDLTFDGNRNKNDGSYSWLLNTAIMAQALGPTTFNSCNFINSPGETIVGHNCIIKNSTFRNLNGSAFHTSMDRQMVTESQIHSEIDNNIFENTNEIPTQIGGHSEGCITHSNSGGYYTAKNNTFIDVGEAVLGLLYPSVSEHDWGTSNILFTQNIIRSSGRLIYSFGILPGTLTNVRIVDNKIYSLHPWDWTSAVEHYPGVVIENQVNQ